MADSKISQLPAVVAVSGTDEFAVNQAFVSKKVSTSQLKSFVSTGSFTGSFAGQMPANNVTPGIFAVGAYIFPLGFTQSSPNEGFHNAGFTEWHELVAVPATPDAAHARIYAADFHGFSSLNMLDSQGLVTKIGQDSSFVVRNNTAATILKGTVVHIQGSQAGSPTVVLAIANSLASMPAAGIVVQDIAVNAYGRIMLHGELDGINTTAFLDGDTLYVSPLVSGGLTKVQPTFPNVSQEIGSVINAATNGTIRINVQGFDRAMFNGSLAVSGAVITPFFDVGTVSSSVTISFTSSSLQMVTLASANATASFTQLQDGAMLTIQVFQDNAGNRSIGQWLNNVVFPASGSLGGVSGTFSTAPGAMDEFRLTYNGRKNKMYARQIAKGF